MLEQVAFINREEELALIDSLISRWDTTSILCINGYGGIGKTRLLQEVHERYIKRQLSHLAITDILDFDDLRLQMPESVASKIAHVLDEKIFEPYLYVTRDYYKMESASVSYDRLTQTLEEANLQFIECFHRLSRQKRVVLFFDTTDAVKQLDFWEYLGKIASKLKNTLMLIAGRNAKSIGIFLQSMIGEDVLQTIDLSPFHEKAGREYLQQKQKQLHIDLEPELCEKLLLLAEGRPILIDLAVEWMARDIPLDWQITNSLTELQTLPENEHKERQHEFEKQLVLNIAQERSDMDTLILWMSRVYPVDRQMIASLLNLSEQDAKVLFEKMQNSVFVKNLVSERITLHDEMRRMIEDYLWDEVDPGGGRRRSDSESVMAYLNSQIQLVIGEIIQIEKKVKLAEKKGEIEEVFNLLGRRVNIEQELWMLKTAYLRHTLFVDINRGLNVFTKLFDEATEKNRFSARELLLSQIKGAIDKLSPNQLYDVNSRYVKHLLDTGEYSQVTRLITDILDQLVLPEQQVNMLISRANAEIRLGNVKNGIVDFEGAKKISEKNTLPVWHIRALNGLGWAYRLTGNFTRAQEYYQEALRLCRQEGGPNREELKSDYGWISNNLAFVLSYNADTRQAAIDNARGTLKYWQMIGNQIGLGACYLVLGIAYYRDGHSKLAEDNFQQALNIFEPLKHNDWLGQIYSWRGALYHHIQEPDKAKKDLEQSLKICSLNIKAMTLDRLGRIYMYHQQWDNAEIYLKQSYELAQQTPDYGVWLVSIGRLITIAVEKGETSRLEEFEHMLQDCLSVIENPDKTSLGVASFELAKLTLMQNNLSKIEKVVDLLKQGITLLTENPYAKTDVFTRLDYLEGKFDKVKPEIIHSIGQQLQEYVTEKEKHDVRYGAVITTLYRWINWKGEEIAK